MTSKHQSTTSKKKQSNRHVEQSPLWATRHP